MRLLTRVVAAALVLAVSACTQSGGAPVLPSGGSPAVAASDTGAESAGPTASTAPVLAAYLAYWSALRHAQAAGDPNDPLLPAHATGAALAEAQDGVRTNQARGVVLKGPVGHHPAATIAGPGEASVRDCLDLSSWLAYRRGDGRRDHSIATLGRVSATYRLVGSGATWRVAEVTQGGDC